MNTIKLKELKEAVRQLVAEAFLTERFGEALEEKEEPVEDEGFSKKTAKSFVKHHKKFADKVSALKDKKGIKEPAALAAWISKQATGKWPSEE